MPNQHEKCRNYHHQHEKKSKSKTVNKKTRKQTICHCKRYTIHTVAAGHVNRIKLIVEHIAINISKN